MAGYYGTLLADMMEGQKMAESKQRIIDGQSLAQERQQTMQMRQQELQRQQVEQQILEQAYRGSAPTREGISEASDLLLESQRASQVANRLMGVDPAKAIQLKQYSAHLLEQKGMLDVRNLQAIGQKNELAGAIATRVYDQASLDAAVKQLTELGDPVPPQFRTWNLETEKYMDSVAKGSKRNVAAVKATTIELNAKTRAKAETDKAEHQKAEDERRARDSESKRHGIDVKTRGVEELELERLKQVAKKAKPLFGSSKAYESALDAVMVQEDRMKADGNGKSVSPEISAALQWLKANPSDPRAEKVRKKLEALGAL